MTHFLHKYNISFNYFCSKVAKYPKSHKEQLPTLTVLGQLRCIVTSATGQGNKIHSCFFQKQRKTGEKTLGQIATGSQVPLF